MAIYTWRSGASAHPEDSVLQFFTDFTDRAGIVNSGDFLVSQKSGTPDMSVDVAVGRAYVYDSSLGSNSYPVRSTAIENLSISPNASGNPRIDSVVLFIDLSASPVSDGTGVATLQVIVGTPSASPVAPTDSEIFTVIGSSNPFLRLADVTVASGATSIVNANILDQRLRVAMSAPSPDSSISAFERQALINGNFSIWQRQSTITQSGSNNLYGFCADRWQSQVYSGIGGGNNSMTISRQAFTLGQVIVPGNPKFYHRFDVTGVGALGSSSAFIRMTHSIENVRTFADGYATFSFYAKANSSRDVIVGVEQNFGTGGSPSAEVTAFYKIISLTTSWQKFTVTGYMPSLSGKTVGTTGNDQLFLQIFPYKQDNGSFSYPSGAFGTFTTMTIDVARCQFNAGDYPLSFQEMTFEDELRRCQRYYEKSYDYSQYPGLATGNSCIQTQFGVTATGWEEWVPYKVKKGTWSVGNVVHTYDVAGNIDRISTKAAYLAGYTNNVINAYGANYEWGFSVYTNNPIQGIGFHFTCEKEL